SGDWCAGGSAVRLLRRVTAGTRAGRSCQDLLLTVTRGADFEEGAARLEESQLDRGCVALSLIPGLERLADRFDRDRLAEQVARAVGKLPPARLPPFPDQGRIGPGQVIVRVHGDVLVLGVLGRAGFEPLGLWSF